MITKKKIIKFITLIGLIILAANFDVFAEGDTDDNICTDGEGGPGITCGRYEGDCWAVDWISPIYYVHCYFSGKQYDHCIPD